MKCERVAELLQSYFDGELAPDVTEQVASAIEECPHCQDELAILVQMREAIRRPILEELEQVSFHGLWEKIDAQLVTEATNHPQMLPARGVQPASAGWFERFAALVSGVFARPALVGAIGVCAIALVVYSVTRDAGVSDTHTAATSPGGVAVNDGAVQIEAPNNLAFVSSVTVSSGSVFIDQDPTDPEAPVIVWHIEDEGDPEQPSPQGG